MDAPQIRIKTERFRAISSADIIINGITVVAGVNGCGKSTLSKLLYFLYKTISNYDLLVTRELRFRLRDLERLIEVIISESQLLSNEKQSRHEILKEMHELHRNLSVLNEIQMKKWVSLIQKVEKSYEILANDNKSLPRINRIRYIVNDILNLKNTYDQFSPLPFDRIIKFFENKYKEALEKTVSRPKTLFIEALENTFSGGKLPEKFEVLEYNELIASIDKTNLSIPYSIQNVIYIDTPMILGVDDFSENEHWDDLNELLVKKGKLSYPNFTHLISNEIINGDITVDDASDSVSDLSFKQNDGSVFSLLDCATGVKSFLILQLLLKNGSITNKTLLIIDEPESNLHPQWIIEYARILVLLNKQVGVKIFIASHNPDMVSALKYISEKEGTGNTLNFYLAEKIVDKYLFNYKHLKTDIDPIFKSFNIAIDRITQYSE